MSPDDIRQQIELQVVELIKEKLADGTMTDERSQQLSKIVLDVLKPGMNFEDLFRAIPKIDDTAPELSAIIVPFLRDYEKNITQHATSGVHDLILQGQYDSAVKLAQKVIDQDVNLMWHGSGKPQ